MEITRIPISARPLADLLPKQTDSNGAAALATSFSDMLKSALNNVNNLQVQADDLATKLAAGQITDVHQVTIASEKATLALQMTLAIRNKVVEAYQEIMRMPL